MGSRLSFLAVLLVLGALVVQMSVFTVDEREHALKFRFGEIVGSGYGPGIHFKIPFINNVEKYPNRILNYDQSEEKFLTGEKKNLIVDYFITWRIIDPGQYYRAAGGDEIFALERLSAIIKEGIKAQFSQRTVQEVVSAERSELMEGMLIQARE
ncbi:MAG: SPFH domain-containing protein, partial [Gammaproteobacteria bacterium]